MKEKGLFFVMIDSNKRVFINGQRFYIRKNKIKDEDASQTHLFTEIDFRPNLKRSRRKNRLII